MDPLAPLLDPLLDHGDWRRQRIAELTAADGWLSLVGLYWLEPGVQTVGSAVGNTLVLAAGPAHWGTLVVGRDIRWQVPGQAERILATDARDQGQEKPSVVRDGEVSFILIERDGQIALRLRNNASPARLTFVGIPAFDFSADWRLDARWDPTPQTLEVATMSGGLETRRLPGRVLFDHDGQTCSLTPLEVVAKGVTKGDAKGGTKGNAKEETKDLFFVFADRTSGRKDDSGTYGAGRFLWARAPENGRAGDSLLLDFNRAYNPPCAFTPFATCPLAPPENRLPFAVSAGEKYVPAQS